MLNSQIDYDADVVAAEIEYQGRMAWEELNEMDSEPVVEINTTSPIGELNQYGDTMSF
jgi:hypothetical protein